MNETTAYQIKSWLDLTVRGSDSVSEFESGLALLAQVMSNTFYVANIRRKEPAKGIETVRYELEKKIAGFKFQVPNSNHVPSSKFQVPSSEVRVASSEKEGFTEKKRLVLRDEFPFLSEPNCPEELKVLVSDMITAHTRYMDGHEKLYHVVNKDNDTCFDAVQLVVENYLNNRKIWDELRYYRDNGKILGEHEIFSRRNRTQELESMSAVELLKLYRNLPQNIVYYKTLITQDSDSDKQIERIERMNWFEFELKVVKRLMGISEVKRTRNTGKRKKPIRPAQGTNKQVKGK